MELRRQILNAYCERMGQPDFWAEPLNAITNFAFILAAILAGRLALREGRVDGPVLFLTINLTAIGIGSFLFHTLATRWAAMADTIPIMIFILGYFFCAALRFMGLSWWQAALATVGFLLMLGGAAAVLRPLLIDVIGRSVSYVPAFLGLIAVGVYLRQRAHPAAPWLFAAGGLFAASLTFRALDMPLCQTLPFGTHFLWHVLNACVLGTLLIAMVRYGRGAPVRPA